MKDLMKMKENAEKWCKKNLQFCCWIHTCLGMGVGMLLSSILIELAILPIAVILILIGVVGHIVAFIYGEKKCTK